MIESLSERISGYVYRNNDRQHVNEDVMKYALISIMTNICTIVLSLSVGLILGMFKETCITLVVTAALRLLAGGHHVSSPLLCVILSAAVVAVVPFIPLALPLIYAFTVISVLLIWKFAPMGFKNNTNISDRSLNIMKIVAMALVLSNFFFQSEMLAVSWMIVSLTLIHFKGGETHE
ncbi:accessory gene regulator ArgB-like protein [Cohnella abietis]|uniref:Accessory gene regulator B n=1 Tax=Cohnella abietis TaxID=2507935 RepID=A0A3T1D0Z3_9BACL|nr:accessory gene regulator B family protein [Cohnella abietis]BBI31754.1 hypothetical protein KCTCHS21_11530 [Cohnella abietis]